MLPPVVDGRTLARWSVRGRCWPELLLEGQPIGVDEFIAGIETQGGKPINLDHVAYGVAGRADTVADPPYFVWVAAKPVDEDELNLTLILLFGGAGYRDVAAGIDPRNYTEQTIAGKDVYVGTEAMLDQGEHQRGRPYFYETNEYVFVVLSDNDAWAAQAIGQLP